MRDKVKLIYATLDTLNFTYRLDMHHSYHYIVAGHVHKYSVKKAVDLIWNQRGYIIFTTR